jgi:hypothetical protein
VITNLSTTTFPVNQATTVTIRGQDFGTNTPALDLPFLGTYTLIGTPTDTQIVASIAPSAVGGGDLGVTAGGFNGQSFEGEGMGSPQGNSTKPVVSFQIVPPAANAILTGNDPAVIAANIYQVIAPMPGTGSVTAVSSQSSDTFAPFAGPPPGTTVTTTVKSTNSNDRTLTFTFTPTGGTSASQAIKTTALQFTYVTNNSPSNTCTLGYGTSRLYNYSVFADPGMQQVPGSLSGTKVVEAFNPALTSCQTVTGNGDLDVNGQFQDNIINCSNKPITGCNLTTIPSISVGGLSVRNNQLVWSSTGVAYTSKGPNPK